MSHHLSNRAWDVELKCNQKIVLLALAHLGVQSTGQCAGHGRASCVHVRSFRQLRAQPAENAGRQASRFPDAEFS
jgi:hypothetical protein